MKVGDSYELSKVISEDDIRKLIEISGDDNPLHTDEEFVKRTIFKGRIAQGILSVALVSAALTKLFGPGNLWMSQTINQEVGSLFGTDPGNVIDYYGMVEQLGVLFLDCPEGYKHIPDFADVIMRDIYTMEETPIGTPGLIEIVSTIGTSYPRQALLTEDIGVVIGIDDCPCGRKGKYLDQEWKKLKLEVAVTPSQREEVIESTNQPVDC